MNLLLAGLETVDYYEPKTYIVKYISQEDGGYSVDRDSMRQLLEA